MRSALCIVCVRRWLEGKGGVKGGGRGGEAGARLTVQKHNSCHSMSKKDLCQHMDHLCRLIQG